MGQFELFSDEVATQPLGVQPVVSALVDQYKLPLARVIFEIFNREAGYSDEEFSETARLMLFTDFAHISVLMTYLEDKFFAIVEYDEAKVTNDMNVVDFAAHLIEMNPGIIKELSDEGS